MNKEFEELSKGLSINMNDLEGELVRSSLAVFRVGRRVIAAVSARDAVKAELKATEAALVEKWRAEAVKTTEKALSNRALTDKALVGLRKELAKAEEVLAEWDNLKECMSSRGFAVHKLASIQMSQSGMNSLETVKSSSTPVETHTSSSSVRRC